MALGICILVFLLAYLAARHSLIYGLAVVLGVGYIHGLIRANIVETASYFIFDAGVLGFYCGQFFRILTPPDEFKTHALRPWVELLIAWPVIMFFVPQQDVLIRLVGLRGNIFMLPFLLIGARMAGDDRYRLALWLAAFNMVALTFAGMEYIYGVRMFFPRSQMTTIIYMSRVYAASDVLRIPATFANAHAFAGTMVMTIPFLAGALVQARKRDWHKPLLIAAVMAALLGVAMSATRVNFVTASLLLLVLGFSLRSSLGYALALLIVVIAVGWFISGEQRLQRFTELQDTQMVSERVVGSVNMGFLELVSNYPLGNGLGGGGTSIPVFLQARISNPVLMENEYARILLEQGILGLLLWAAFLIWLLTRTMKNSAEPWYLGRRLAWWACAAYLGLAMMGIGLLISIPQTCLLLLSMGWLASPQYAADAEAQQRLSPTDYDAQAVTQ